MGRCVRNGRDALGDGIALAVANSLPARRVIKGEAGATADAHCRPPKQAARHGLLACTPQPCAAVLLPARIADTTTAAERELIDISINNYRTQLSAALEFQTLNFDGNCAFDIEAREYSTDQTMRSLGDALH